MKLAKGVPGGWLWTNVVPAPSEQHSDRQEKQVVDAQLEMVRAVRRANRKLTKQEVLDRVSRQSPAQWSLLVVCGTREHSS